MTSSDESFELLALLSVGTSADLLAPTEAPAPPGPVVDASVALAAAVTDSSSASGTDEAWQGQDSCVSDREAGVAKKQKRERLTKKRVRKPCKPTYYVRKEEKHALLEEIESLQAQVEHLQLQSPPPGISAADAMIRGKVVNMLLRGEVVKQQYALAGLQSAHTGYLSAQDTLPFQRPIRLGKDWNERRATLAATKNEILRDAVRYVTERSQFLDPSMVHSETSRYLTANGDFCALRFDIDQIHGAKSVKQVFDALQSYFFSIEISISEELGDITIREDDDHQERGISQSRFVSNIGNAEAQVELNCAMFCEFSSGGDSRKQGFGVIVTDFVDDDELFPYSPGTRARQDITAVLTVAPLVRKKTHAAYRGDDDDEELVVALTRCSLLKLHLSGLALSQHAQQEMREQVGHWGDLVMKKLRENLRVAT